MGQVVVTSLEARLAAERMSMARRVPGTTVQEVTSFIMLAEQSLWYSQAGQWLENPACFMKENTRVLYDHAFRFIRGTVDIGFDGKVWWNAEKFLSGPVGYTYMAAVLREYIILADVTIRLAVVRKGTNIVVSTGFDTFSEIVLGRDWPRSFTGLGGQLMGSFDSPKAFKEALLAGSPQFMDLLEVKLKQANITEAPCINEFCTNGPDGGRKPVDLLKRKSGACCKDCMNYECSHPDCVKKAGKHSWPRYTHRWGTKIAQTHMEWRVENGKTLIRNTWSING